MSKEQFSFNKGWSQLRQCDISKCRRPEELPREAMDYVKYIEKAVGCPIKYVSVGAERDEYVEMF